MDIVANFLGHDLHVHREFYRLPNEVLQVAKVTKILLTMEQGGEGLSQGETLDNVPVLNEELGNDDFEVSDAEDAINESHSPCLDAESLGTPERHTKRKHPPKMKNQNIRKWKQWSPGEKAAVQCHFHRLLLTNTLPGKSQIEQCLKEEPILHKRTWRNIKDYIRNSFKQKKGCR
ncbi:uncharacterized protein LOC105441828 [Strongylocentrotus purpuratus]|uniref:Uncharacterized protein n=1 Tax=Strongylocentrotus purpuratus TaxID=7668 RepID=A0A7M7N3P3_STRPU|nr:uncharacterized protein LOC105441828 [Strongylocentrotus purpuratus]